MIESGRAPGRNFTDRQRIKRKAARWAAKFAALPPIERSSVMEAINEASRQTRVNVHDARQDQIDFGYQRELLADLKAKHCPQSEMTMPNVCTCGHLQLDHEEDWNECCGLDSTGCFCRCQFFAFPPMPDSGVTKLSPRDSAERGGGHAR